MNWSGRTYREEAGAEGGDAGEGAGGQGGGDGGSLLPGDAGNGLDPEVYGAPGEDGRPANVPAKFWDGEGKSIKWGDVLTQHNHLDSKLGGFTGAPEKYELTLSDNAQTYVNTAYGDDGIPDDDPLLTRFAEFARENNMNNDMYNGGVNLLMEFMAEQNAVDRQSELQALGNNGQQRVGDIATWVGSHLTEEQRQDVYAITDTAAGVRAVEALIAKTKQPMLPSEGGANPQGLTKDAIEAERWKDDPNNPGTPLYNTSKEHRAKVTQMYKDFYGEDPKVQTIGPK